MTELSTITYSPVLPTFHLQNFRPSAVLLQGDSALRLKAIRSNSIGAVVCDPPYDLAYANNDWDRALPDIAIWKECFRVLKPGGYLVAFGSPKTSHRLTMQLEDVGFILGGRLVWEYPNGTPACQRISDTHHARVKPAHEDIILVMKPIAAKTMKAHRELHGNGGLRVVDTLGDGTIKMTTSILKHNKPTPTERNLGVEHFSKRRVIERDESDRSLMKESMHQNFHPCPKPAALLAHLSLLVADPGETILDPFMGSGSGGLAAIWRGFNYIGIELSPDYFEIAKARVEYALNNDAFRFPLDAAMRRKRAATDRTKAKHPQFWQNATDDLGTLDLLRAETVEPAPEEYLPVEWRSRKRPTKAQPKGRASTKPSEASADGPVNQVETAIGRQTEEALSAAALGPDIANLPLDGFRLLEVPPLVFHHKDAPVRKHRHTIRVKLVLGEARRKSSSARCSDSKNEPGRAAHLESEIEVLLSPKRRQDQTTGSGERTRPKPSMKLHR